MSQNKILSLDALLPQDLEDEADLIPLMTSDDEEAMLDDAYNVKPNSRLGCQISITTELEGAEFELAPEEP